MQVYFPHIDASLHRHFLAVNRMTKQKSTRNPYFPAGSSTRLKLYGGKNLGLRMTTAQLDAASYVSMNYWRRTRAHSLLPRMWERDPVTTGAGRRARRMYVEKQVFRSLRETYSAYRECTIALRDMGY